MKPSPGRFPIIEAIADAYHRRLNTRIVFRRNEVEGSVILLFRKGLFVNSNEKKDRLELMLAARKLLGKEDILRIAAKARAQGLDFMTVLQREGILKDVALVDLMSERARNIVKDLMEWRDVEVELDPRGLTAEPVLPLNLDLMPILLDALVARLAVEDCRHLLGSEDSVPLAQDCPYAMREFRRSNHGDLVQSVFAQVDGKRSVAEVLGAQGSDTMTGMKMLSALKLLGAVAFADQPATMATPVQVQAPKPTPQPAVASAAAAPQAPDPDLENEALAPQLSAEERDALSNIFEGAANVLEDPETDGSEFHLILDDDDEGADGHVDVVAGEPDSPEDDSDVDGDIIIGGEDDGESEGAPFTLHGEPGESTEVRANFNALLDIDPEEAGRLFADGLDLFQQGQILAAREIYQLAVDKDPSNAEYYTALGLAQMESSDDGPADDAAAMRAFHEAINLAPELPKNHYYLGRIHESRRDQDAAIQAYQEALKLDASYTPAREALDRLTKKKARGADTDSGKLLRKLFGR